jgi:hypothetical protein
LVKYAWEARGSGLGYTVTPDGRDKFYRRLAQAREALEAAWQAAPGSARAATLMLNVELGDSRGWAAMEQWFERAMQADSDNQRACWLKMEWLHPKWHGTRDELVAFGKACRDTNNWRAGIPLLVAEAHLGVTDDLLLDNAGKNAYMRRDDVWGDIEMVYTEHLKHRPKDNLARTQFGYYSYLCSRPAMAHHQFRLLGNNLVWSGRITEEQLKGARDAVAKAAGAKPG